MLSYDQIKDKPRVLLSFTGLTQTEFEELLIAFAFASFQVSNAVVLLKMSYEIGKAISTI